MHLHEEPDAAPTADPTRVHVTAEELAAAVAALETRKTEGASGTIAIDDAIRELGLDAVPEEVWAEIQACRRAQIAPPRNAPLVKRTRRRRRLSAVIVAMVGILAGTGVVGAHLHTSSRTVTSPWPSLADIPDGVPVYAEEHNISDLLNGKDPALTLVSPSVSQYNDWVLIRHDGKVYLRGFALVPAGQPAVIKRLSLYSVNSVGELAGQSGEYVTIPLKGTHWEDGRSTNGWGEIALTNVHPDTNFHDQ